MNTTSNKTCLHCGEEFIAKRSTKKYCSETCKVNAFYQRNLKSEELTRNDKEDLEAPPEIQDDPLNEFKHEIIKSGITVNPPKLTLNDKPTVVKPLIPNATTKLEEYQWQGASINESICNRLEEKVQDFMRMKQAQKYWSYITLPKVKWVSTRLRSIVEEILVWEKQKKVNLKQAKLLANSLILLMDNDNYKYLPSDYPFKDSIESLQEWTYAFVSDSLKYKAVLFNLSKKEKINAIVLRYMLASFVDHTPISKLDFEK